ncbi:DNA translocase FtsK, partial [Pseudomonas aeruginosa]|nr:DNA translocase FtsK [Pseudomonas aeruginosa]
MTAQTAATIAQDLVEEFDEEQPATVASLAAETLGRDLLQALLQEVRVLPDVWPKLTEKKQADVIDRLR